jgi:hypothetical protein
MAGLLVTGGLVSGAWTAVVGRAIDAEQDSMQRSVRLYRSEG